MSMALKRGLARAGETMASGLQDYIRNQRRQKELGQAREDMLAERARVQANEDRRHGRLSSADKSLADYRTAQMAHFRLTNLNRAKDRILGILGEIHKRQKILADPKIRANPELMEQIQSEIETLNGELEKARQMGELFSRQAGMGDIADLGSSVDGISGVKLPGQEGVRDPGAAGADTGAGTTLPKPGATTTPAGIPEPVISPGVTKMESYREPTGPEPSTLPEIARKERQPGFLGFNPQALSMKMQREKTGFRDVEGPLIPPSMMDRPGVQGDPVGVMTPPKVGAQTAPRYPGRKLVGAGFGPEDRVPFMPERYGQQLSGPRPVTGDPSLAKALQTKSLADEAQASLGQKVRGKMEQRLPRSGSSTVAKTYERYRDLIDRSSRETNVPPQVLAALLHTESRGDPDVVSHVGAKGIAQFMDPTADEMGLNDPFDPNQAIPASARYLAKLYKMMGSWPQAVMAYNAGPGRIRSGKIPEETQNYIKGITQRAAELGYTL